MTTSFFRYPYPLLDAVESTPWGFGLAADADIAAMKIEAIAGRGGRKDFIDLRILVPFDWNEAKQFFTHEATRLLAAETGERPWLRSSFCCQLGLDQARRRGPA